MSGNKAPVKESALSKVSSGRHHLHFGNGVHLVPEHLSSYDFLRKVMDSFGLPHEHKKYILIAYLIDTREKVSAFDKQIHLFLGQVSKNSSHCLSKAISDIKSEIIPAGDIKGHRDILDCITLKLLTSPDLGSLTYRCKISDIWISIAGGKAIPLERTDNSHELAVQSIYETHPPLHQKWSLSYKDLKHSLEPVTHQLLENPVVIPLRNQYDLRSQLEKWPISKLQTVTHLQKKIEKSYSGLHKVIAKDQAPVLKELMNSYSSLKHTTQILPDEVFPILIRILGTELDLIRSAPMAKSEINKIIDGLDLSVYFDS